MTKKIRSKVVKESLLDYNTLANSLKENTESAVKTLLDEAVRDTYAKLLSEDDDKDYEEEEVEDTDSDASDNAEGNSVDSVTDDTDDVDSDLDADEAIDGEDADVDDASSEDADADTSMEQETDVDVSTEDDGDGEDEWAEFDKYKVSDDEYDFSDAEDEEIVKVYKLMKNDDQILVHDSGDNKVSINDKETGAEYLIDLGDNSSNDGEDILNDDADDFSAEKNDFDDMNESTERLFELVLEYDSNVGYTDNYQKKDVMTNPGMSEPGKNVNDWDAGVPHGTEKPWSKKNKKADKPFGDGSGKKIEEDEVDDSDNGAINELKTNAEHSANVGSTSRTDGPNNPRTRKGRSFHTAQGGQERGTSDNPYVGRTDESLNKRINKALRENKELRLTLEGVMASLREAAVTNHNLAQIIKLVTENTTSQDEKQEIISRFAKEAKTIKESKNLYNTISNELKKSNKMNITEEKNLSVNGTKRINETTIYKSPDVLDSLDLMHRMMK